MRALNSRRSRLTGTFYLFPRVLLCPLLLLLLFRVVESRSVSYRDEGNAAHRPEFRGATEKNQSDSIEMKKGKIVESERVQETIPESQNRRLKNDKIVSEESENQDRKIPQSNVGARSQDQEGESVSVEQLQQDGEEASVVKKRRRNDVALSGKSDVSESETDGIRRFDARLDADDVAASGTMEASLRKDEVKESTENVQPDESSGNVPSYFRKSGKIEDDIDKSEEEIASNENSESDDELQANREYRSFSKDKFKRKSTVYLSAEEKKIPDGEQQSIVDGQIKKLISIRDDALDAKKSDKIEEAQVLTSEKEVDIDVVSFSPEMAQDNVEIKDSDLTEPKETIENRSLLKGLKDQAVLLQEQIRNRTILQRLKEQVTDVLPGIPKFTENQLLETLEQIVNAKRLQPLNESYVIVLKDLGLNENQLRIVKCAEQLIAINERQSFATNLAECVRGLSILNCMRIFVWPIVIDNLPETISQSLGNLPIEVNVFDLFQGNREKSGRAQGLHRVRLLTPNTVVYNILQDALETYPNDETLISYVDPKNETLKNLLSSDQLDILQMAEKFLPQILRQEYSEKMFSCIRQFEYFSCVKYFAWPLIKQYFPALPAFPDYQNWYPLIDLSSRYPILSYPSFPGDVGELPEVVDADATRTKKPRPEAIIVQILQDTLKEQARISSSPSSLEHSTDTYVTLIPQDQLLTINMAEQLIPISQRSAFIEKTVRCMKEYNYLTCFKYSTWPTVRHFVPTLPDISSLLPDFLAPGLPDVNGYISEIPTYSEYYFPNDAADFQKELIVPEYVSQNRANSAYSSDELETSVLEILQRVQSSIDASVKSPVLTTLNAINIPSLSRRQIDILQLAESLVPDSVRPAFNAEILAYLQRNNNFADCVRYVIWPTITKYVPTFPEFPSQEITRKSSNEGSIEELLNIKGSRINSQEIVQDRINLDAEKGKVSGAVRQNEESRNRVSNVPTISVSGIRFVPIFTDHPETVILNILRSVQLQSLKTNGGISITKNQQFLDLLNDQQISIINAVDTLIPENVRPTFANNLIDCLRINNFLICTRDIIWPVVSQYFPWLPNFPDFGVITSGTTVTNTSSVTTVNQTLTEPSSNLDSRPLSETDVKTGQHGDTTVTITDTRFFPILNELPETIILNILKAVQLSVPNLPESSVSIQRPNFSEYLTEQQINVVNAAEELLPISMKQEFLDKLNSCITERSFLECTRDIVWPTIAQTYTWLPSFPNFGSLNNSPQQGTPGSTSSIRSQVILSEKPSSPNLDSQTSGKLDSNSEAEGLLSREAEKKIESVLLEILSKLPQVDKSYLDINDPIFSRLNTQQISIVKLVERGIPEKTRQQYISRMVQCLSIYNFLACTKSIAWPILKEYSPLLPDLVNVTNLFSQLPGILQIPDTEQLPGVSDTGSISGNVPGISQFPGIIQIPTTVPQFPLPFGGLLGQKHQNSPGNLRQEETLEKKSNGSLSTTSSVGNEGVVPEYAGQPSDVLVDLQEDKIHSPGNQNEETMATEKVPSLQSNTRKRRNVMDIVDSYRDTEQAAFISSPSDPNITESEYLRLLIRVKELLRYSSDVSSTGSKSYLVDRLNSTLRNSLTADQNEILKILEDLDNRSSGKGLASQVIQCVTSLSFIRCLGIFVWPLIASNLPSFGVPSLPSFGILGRSMDTESQVREFFGMSTEDFEKRLIERKESIETSLLDWYKELVEEKFQMDIGFVKIKGLGNSELGISFTGFRKSKGAKIKDNKNLPSILTIISDIMEEVLDQRPDGEKPKKEKKERSIDSPRESDIQFLKNSEEYLDIKRSMNDQDIITMFLDKIKTNESEMDEDDEKYLSTDDAYDAFGILFGTKLYENLDKDSVKTLDPELMSFEEDSIDPSKEVDIVSLDTQRNSEESMIASQKKQESYESKEESKIEQEGSQRQKRARDFLKSFLQKYSKDRDEVNRIETIEDNKVSNDRMKKRDGKSSLIVRLPRLNDLVLSEKVTNSMTNFGRAFDSKMSQMAPGFGMVLSFLLQMAVAHARAAASMAGMISNIALGSAMFGMLRDSLFGGNNHPQIKYVYDNYKTGPGISWPTHSGAHYQ